MTSIDGPPRRASGFDFLVGNWLVDNRRLREPLSATDSGWYDTPASSTSRTLHNGAISIDEMWFPELGFAGSSIRLHQARTDLWTVYWVNSESGELQPPVHGRWNASGDRFEAQGPDEYDGREIVARYLWHSVTPDTATWEQAFSVDGGRTWETNWTMSWRRDPDSP